MHALSGSASATPQKTRRLKIVFFAMAIACVAILLGYKARAYLQAYAILSELNGQPVPHILRPIAAIPVTTRTFTIPSSAGPVSARLYTSHGHPGVPGLVVVPGIHYQGMNEPRLMAFARALASCGLRVLTPELPDSRDYQIQPSDAQAIGDSVQWLRHATGRRVGLMGLGFSGGLALMAASELPYSKDVSFVFSVGAHDDLFRVASFYTNHADPLPNGDVEHAIPNDYGPMVMEYEHLEDFTLPADTDTIRPVFRARLYGNYTLEKQLLAKLTDAQKAEYAHIVDTPHQDWALSASNNKHAAEMSAVSPRGHLAGLHVPVYVLHGRGDTLIPFAEAEWLAQDLPHGTLADLVISPLLGHVNITEKTPDLWDRWQLLHLLAQVMERAEHTS